MKLTLEDVRSRFIKHFDGATGSVYASPGRINLIGEHTDYNNGYVFPGAVEQGIIAELRPNGTNTVDLYSIDYKDRVQFDLNDTEGPRATWARYIYGVCREMMALGVKVAGFNAAFAGDVPLGAGMSSSAALESCFAFALNDLFAGGGIAPMELARVGQRTEHKYVGCNCGIMDQFASVHGKKGSLMRLDCRSGEFEYFPWAPKGYQLVLVNSCVKHELVGSPYNERREACEQAAAIIAKRYPDVQTLRDATMEMLEAVKAELTEEQYKRAQYVIGEMERVLAVCDALKAGDYERVGTMMYATHEGLSKAYEVSCEEL
ncbi:MAG: galactokinase, partial [Bacteroidales bacterium]|nr:galactokinase [Candidatus Equimonas enterica]